MLTVQIYVAILTLLCISPPHSLPPPLTSSLPLTPSLPLSPPPYPSLPLPPYPSLPLPTPPSLSSSPLPSIGVGCAYGFAVVDYVKNETIYVHCTFDQALEDLNSMSRMQSIRRSFRHSMQRVNIRRSMRGLQSVNRSIRRSSDSPLARSGSARPALFNRVSSVRRSRGSNAASSTKENVPPPSAASQATGAAPPPMKRDSIRTMTFTAPTHVGGSSLVHGLLVGTNQGAVLGFTVDVPVNKQRGQRSPVVMPVGKNIIIIKSTLFIISVQYCFVYSSSPTYLIKAACFSASVR